MEEGEQEEEEGEAKKGDDQDEGQKHEGDNGANEEDFDDGAAEAEGYEVEEVEGYEEGLLREEGTGEEEARENDEILEAMMAEDEKELDDMMKFLQSDHEEQKKKTAKKDYGPLRPDQFDTLPMESDPDFWRLDSKEDSQVLIYSPPDETKAKAPENAEDDKKANKKSNPPDEKVQAKLKDMPAAVWTTRCRRLKNPDAENEKAGNETESLKDEEEVKTKQGKHLDKKDAPNEEDAPKTKDDDVKPKRSKSAKGEVSKQDTHKGSSTDKAAKDPKKEKTPLESKASSKDKTAIPNKKDPEEPKEIELVSDENEERENRGTFKDRINIWKRCMNSRATSMLLGVSMQYTLNTTNAKKYVIFFISSTHAS